MSRVPEAPTRELYGPSIDALRPVPGRARNGTVGYQNETLKRQPGSGSGLPCSDNARNAARSVYTAANTPSTALGTAPCFSVPRTRGSPRRRFRRSPNDVINHEFRKELAHCPRAAGTTSTLSAHQLIQTLRGPPPLQPRRSVGSSRGPTNAPTPRPPP